MKKLIVMGSLLLCLALAGCGAGNQETKANDPAQATTGKEGTQGNTDAAAQTTTAVEETTIAATEPAFTPKGKVDIEPVQVPSGYSLKDLGPMEEGNGTISFQMKNVLRYEVAEDNTYRYIPIDHMGKELSEERFAYIDALKPGFYLVSSFEETINNTGLMTASGEVLIPCEAAIIKELKPRNSSDDAESRFLLVAYGTEKTDDQNEAFFYATEAWFSIAPQEGDQYYKGYAQIYDLENRCFVPEVTITKADTSATRVCGNLIYTETPEGVQLIYNAEGKELFRSSVYYSVDLGNGFYKLDSNEIYDSEGELLFKTSGFVTLSIIKGSARFLNRYVAETNTYTICDFYGNELFDLPEGINYVSFEQGGLFSCHLEDTAILYNAQGEVVFSQENSGSAPAYRGYGIWEITAKDSEAPSTFFLADGRTTSGKRYPYNLTNKVQEEKSGVFSFYPWNNPTEKVSFEWSYATQTEKGLVYNTFKPGQLTDVFSGELLLEADRINFINGYVYAQIDGVYHVFEPVLK